MPNGLLTIRKIVLYHNAVTVLIIISNIVYISKKFKVVIQGSERKI